MNATLTRSKTFFTAALFSLLLFSCRTNLLPAYREDLSVQLDDIGKQIDKLYLTMLDETNEKDGSRAYKNFAKDYIDIQVELNSFLLKNKVRPLNKNSVRNSEIAVQEWTDFKEEHRRKKTLPDGVIRYNRKYMSDLIYAMMIAEEVKK